VKAEALSAGATDLLRGPVGVSVSLPARPEAEVALPAAARLRAALTGCGLAALAVAAATVLALLIVAGPFHTSIGSIR
jgi:hypothetical protein